MAAAVHVWAPSAPARQGLLGLLIIVAAAGLALVALSALRRRDLTGAALRLESHYPELRDRLATVVDESPLGFRNSGFSSGLRTRAIADAAATCAGLEFGAVVDWRPARRNGLVAIGGSLALAGLALLAPGMLGALLGGRAAPVMTSSGPAVSTPASRALPAHVSPALADVAVECIPPPYCGRPRARHDPFPERLSVLAGTRLIVTGRVPAPGVEVALLHQPRDGPGGRTTAKIADRRFQAEWVAVRSGELWLESSRAEQTWRGPRCLVTTEPDAKPEVRITKPGRDVQWARPGALALSVSAADDFGVTAVWLEHRLADDAPWQRQSIPHDPGATVDAQLRWDLRPLNLRAGDAVSYRAAARDNDTVTGPKIGRSRTFRVTLRQPTPAQQERELRAAEERERTAIEQLRDRVEQLAHRLQELEGSLRGDGNAEEQARQRAELQEAQRELQRLAESLNEALRETEQEIESSGAISPAVAEKLQQLHELIRETIKGKLSQAFEQMEEAFQAQRTDEMRRAAQDARQTQEDVLAQLDQALSLLKRLQLQSRVERAADLAERLADEQDKLAERRQAQEQEKEPSRDELQQQAQSQEALEEQARSLEDEAGQLAEEAQDQQAPGAEQLTQLEDMLRQQPPSQDMQRAAERLAQADPSGAQTPQRQASRQLRQSAAQLNQALSQMSGEAMRKLREGLSEAIQGALELSQEQESVLRETEQLAGARLPSPFQRGQYSAEQKYLAEELGRRQRAVARGTSQLGSSLRELAQETQALDPALPGQVGRLAERMGQAQRELTGGAADSAGRGQRGALADLNELARRLLSMTQQAGEQAQQMADQQVMQLLRALANQQRDLNQQTQQLAGQQGAQPQPGGEQSGDLAGIQGELREALERMLEQGAGQGLANQLGQAPGQMDEVEQDLRREQITKRTLRTQEEVLHRMLDAQRSLHEKEQRHHQRKAERPQDHEPLRSPPELTLSQKRLPSREQSASVPPDEALPLGFEELVRGYYRALLRQGRRP